MKQNVGLSALVIAAFAFAIHTGGPGSMPNQSAASQNGQTQANPGATTDILEGPWLATRAFFQSADDLDPGTLNGPNGLNTPSAVQNCVAAPPGSRSACAVRLAGYFGIPDAHHVRFLIATVPDPLHTRLSLFTDYSIQAIEEGADASGWIFADQWLPWIDKADPEEKDPEKRRQQRADIRTQEKQPGILVFRRNASSGERDVLLIFLVGETPTGGVDPAQFQLARAYTRGIEEPADKILILGPTFSGSFESLGQLLAEDRTYGPVPAYRVRSGTATVFEDGVNFQSPPGIDFKSATADTVDQARYFRRVLSDLRIDPEHAASLIEDESLFGKTATKQSLTGLGGPIRVLRFPRDISHLRNSYRGDVAASTSGNGTPPDIRFSITDPEKGEDSIPMFSGSQSPLSQYGVINRITHAIDRDDIRLVQVSATNVLDMLFLADILKRQCPDTRLLLNYPDVLLVQAAQSEPLTGTLVMASYPEFFASNYWMGGAQANEPVTFPDANSEGVYNAAVLLLNNDSEASLHLADYRWRALHHPPTWLLTLDRRGFLPVDVFPHDATEEKNERWFQTVTPREQEKVALPSPPRIWSFTSTALALACIALSVWIWWISSHPKYEMDARFSSSRIDSESHRRRLHIFALLIVLLLMEITFGIPALRLAPPTGFILLLAGSGIFVLCSAWRVLKNLQPNGKEKRAVWLLAGGAGTFLALWFTSCFFFDDRGMFFAFRARELRFGSSPTWPVITSLSAFALFSFIHLTRYYLAACQKPDIVTSGLSPALDARLSEAVQDFNGALEGSRGLRFASRTQHSIGPILFALACSVVAVMFRVDRLMRSIDGPGYDLLALVLPLVVIALLLLTCLHVRSLWRSLQSFLASLSMLPLAHSFRPVDRSGAGRPIWVRRLNLQSVGIHIQAIYVLHNMTILEKDVTALDPSCAEFFVRVKTRSEEYRNRIRELLQMDPHRFREQTLKLKKEVRSDNTAIAKETFAILHGFWARSSLGAPELAKCPDPGSMPDATDPAPEANPLDRLAGLAERFVALHYSSFIVYGVRQIQNLLLFLPCGFVLLMISLNCYSVQAPQFIGRLLLILSLLLGAATLSCLVGLEKDPVLSRMAGSEPGKLNTGFYLKVAAYGALPVLSLLASEFPSISSFLLSWVEPGLEAFK